MFMVCGNCLNHDVTVDWVEERWICFVLQQVCILCYSLP